MEPDELKKLMDSKKVPMRVKDQLSALQARLLSPKDALEDLQDNRVCILTLK